MSTSTEKRPRSSDMDSHDAKATKKAKSPKGPLKTTVTTATAGSTAGAMNGNGASRKVAANSNGNSSRDGKAREQAHPTNGDDNSGTVESRPPQKLRQETKARGVDEVKATASATKSGGSKAKASSSAETTSSSTTTEASFEQASVSWAWYYSILFWVAVLLLLTNVVTLGMWLETKMEYELRTAELQEQVKELPQLLQDVASWEEFGRATERYRNDCADSLKEMVKEQGGECIDTDAECPIWAEDGQCFQNPSFMLLSCRVSCDSC
jgi:hypothetical protein